MSGLVKGVKKEHQLLQGQHMGLWGAQPWAKTLVSSVKASHCNSQMSQKADEQLACDRSPPATSGVAAQASRGSFSSRVVAPSGSLSTATSAAFSSRRLDATSGSLHQVVRDGLPTFSQSPGLHAADCINMAL